jgi:hypothetical protein
VVDLVGFLTSTNRHPALGGAFSFSFDGVE